MDIIDEIKDRLSIFKNLYDIVRIVDPLNKKTIIIQDGEIEKTDEHCYNFWERGTFCENCIAMRAYLNDDTFVKLEYTENKTMLIMATPIEVNEKKYIVEILKDITNNGSALYKLSGNDIFAEEQISTMNEKAIKDELTGVFNRRYINERLPVDINYSLINKHSLSIIMVDIDFFKKVNDEYGHLIGDKVLKDFANVILKSIRSTTDWIGRYGGEEFLLVLNNTDSENAYIVAEKIRKDIENTVFKYDDVVVKITASFGVYGLGDTKVDSDNLIAKADKNLYQAKNSGRNKTIAGQMDCNEV